MSSTGCSRVLIGLTLSICLQVSLGQSAHRKSLSKPVAKPIPRPTASKPTPYILRLVSRTEGHRQTFSERVFTKTLTAGPKQYAFGVPTINGKSATILGFSNSGSVLYYLTATDNSGSAYFLDQKCIAFDGMEIGEWTIKGDVQPTMNKRGDYVFAPVLRKVDPQGNEVLSQGIVLNGKLVLVNGPLNSDGMSIRINPYVASGNVSFLGGSAVTKDGKYIASVDITQPSGDQSIGFLVDGVITPASEIESESTDKIKGHCVRSLGQISICEDSMFNALSLRAHEIVVNDNLQFAVLVADESGKRENYSIYVASPATPIKPEPEVRLAKASEGESKTVSIEYDVTDGSLTTPVELSAYHSADPKAGPDYFYQSGEQSRYRTIGTTHFKKGDLSLGHHTIKVFGGTDFTPTPERPYIVVLAINLNGNVSQVHFRK